MIQKESTEWVLRTMRRILRESGPKTARRFIDSRGGPARHEQAARELVRHTMAVQQPGRFSSHLYRTHHNGVVGRSEIVKRSTMFRFPQTFRRIADNNMIDNDPELKELLNHSRRFGKRTIPTALDDINRDRTRSWKIHRKSQYRFRYPSLFQL